MIKRISFGAAFAAMLIIEPAHAFQFDTEKAAANVIDRLCSSRPGVNFTRADLAQELVVEARPSRPVREWPQLIDKLSNGEIPEDARRANLVGLIFQLQTQLLVSGSVAHKKLLVSTADGTRLQRRPDQELWLISTPGLAFSCAGTSPRLAEEDAGGGETDEALPVDLLVRGSVDALDEEQDSAAAAQVSWEDSRVTDLNGKTTRSESFGIDATLGLRLGGDDDHGVAFASYTLNRTSTIETGQAEAKVEEVDALELGGLVQTRLFNKSVGATARIGFILDEVTGARYLRGNFQIEPYQVLNLGVCSLNAFGDDRLLPVRGKCVVNAEVELRNVLRVGSAGLGQDDVYLAAGGTIGYEFAPRLRGGEKQDGLTGSARYTYLAMLDGSLRDIDRFETNLSYRFWFGSVAFDIGLEYADGTERKSFADENRLSFRIGLLH